MTTSDGPLDVPPEKSSNLIGNCDHAEDLNMANTQPDPRRKLAALMFTDMVGSSRLFNKEESAARAVLDHMFLIVRESVARHGGREVDTAGDGFFLQFSSAVEAITCAYEIQARIYESNLEQPEELRFQIRIGIHVGDFVEWENRAIGDDVNIASRIEKLAESGGIAVSQQVVDQVAGKFDGNFRDVGFVPLKNIQRKVRIHHVRLPWKEGKKKWGEFFRARTFRRTKWMGLSAMACAALVTFAYLGVVFYRNIQIPTPVARISLEDGWEIQTSQTADWVKYDREHNWVYADKVNGPYRLRKKFLLSTMIAEPAIVLGYIPNRYRLFVNGHMIGGANRESPIEYFAFDPSVLQLNGENLLEIEAETTPTVRPGLNVFATIGSFLSDLDYAASVIHYDRIIFHARQVTLFSLSALMFFACLLAWALAPSNRTRAYQSVYLLTCLLVSIHYLVPFMALEPFWIRQALKHVSLCAGQIVLVSSYLAAMEFFGFELINNVVFFGMSAWILGSFASVGDTPSELLNTIKFFMALTVAYAFVTSIAILVAQRSRRFTPTAIIVPAFNIVTSLIILVELPGHMSGPFLVLRYHAFNALITYPFFFSVALAMFGAWDHSRKSAEAKQRLKAIEVHRKLLSVLVRGKSFRDKLERVQRIACRHIGIGKSTIYLSDRDNGRLMLRAVSVVRNVEHASLVASEVVDPTKGILGYVCTVKSPLLIEDLGTDARFSGYMNQRSSDQYYTKSCMVFPVVKHDEVLGVMTFSDKTDRTQFSETDFKFASQAAQIMQLLCQMELSDGFDPAIKRSG